VADASEAHRADLVAGLRNVDPSLTVIEAAHGKIAMEALRDGRIDVAFVDRCLPGIDGQELLRWIRQERRTQFVLVTDRLTARWVEVAVALNADEVVIKPVPHDKLGFLLEAFERIRTPANVLVVEGAERLREILVRMIRHSRFTFNLDITGTGDEALRALVPEFYDVAVVNLCLGGDNGLETALQVLARSSSTRIITIGHYGRLSNVSLIKLGVAAHLKTPFGPHELERALHSVFGLWCPSRLKAMARFDLLDQSGVDGIFSG
jgi:DNA-binding response OmpR family regulator